MRLTVVQHVPFEGPGAIRRWAEARGHALDVVRLDAGEALPSPESVDAFVVLGGPMGVHDAAPFLAAERRWLRDVVAAGRPVLGVCLGAQLLADALGADVRRHVHREIGWWPVVRTAAGRASPLTASLLDGLAAFHWHGDTYDLPVGAVRLLASAGCPEQAFAVGDRLVGLQLHLEIEPGGVDDLVQHGADDLAPGPFTQSAAAVRAVQPEHLAALHAGLDALLDAWARAAARDPDLPHDAAALLDAWFGDATASPAAAGARGALWFGGGPAVDEALGARFGHLVAPAREGRLDGWATTPRGALALLLALDQLPRNVGRGTPAAFASDPAARRVLAALRATGGDRALHPVERGFAYLPLQHAEDLATQDDAVATYAALADDTAREHPAFAGFVTGQLAYARTHRDIVARFGRFPGRNEALGRPDTADETAWLAAGGETFGARPAR